MAISSVLCDFNVGGVTCDTPLCADHAHEVGPDRHLCPIHAAQANHNQLAEVTPLADSEGGEI